MRPATIHVRLTEDAKARLTDRATATGRKVSSYVERLIVEHLEQPATPAN